MNLQDKVAVVTGASTGIGRAIAIAFGKKGAKVALVGRNIIGLNKTKEEITKSGGFAKVFEVDLRTEQEINNFAEQVLNLWGAVDVVANVAGVWHDDEKAFYGVPLHETPSSQINDVMDVNIRAPMLLTRLFIPCMIEKKQGKIINISGTFSSGGAGWLHYYVSKLAVEHFTKGLSDELRKYEIQVNCISPSDTASEALVKFFGDDSSTALAPDDIARLALYLVTDPEADNITGQTIVIKSKLAY